MNTTKLDTNQQAILGYALGYFRLYEEADVAWSEEKIESIRQNYIEFRNELAEALGCRRYEAADLIRAAYAAEKAA